MCGILGLIHSYNYSISFDDFKDINKLNAHRGPDDNNELNISLKNYFVKIGHTRLSIQDLSSLAKQPMKSFSERYLISFNGEIYNHKKLRKEIDKKKLIKWKTNSDTETLVNLFEIYEFADCIQMIEGMFSFILIDLKENYIYFCRDLSGEKPLYIQFNNNFIAAASDLNSIKSIDGFEKNINQISLQNYLQYNYIPYPKTIFEGTYKLPPASFLKIDLNKFKLKKFNSFSSLTKDNACLFDYWWKLNIDRNYFKKFNDFEINEFVHQKIKKSISNQLISDVPLGAFLSAGTDSSLIVSMMQQLQTNTKTFTIGYENEDYDESNESKKIAQYLSTDHTSYNFSNDEIIRFIKDSKTIFSEPFADSSQLPTLLVSKIAKEKVKVALTGDGGDELFGGYNRYIYANKYWKLFSFFNPTLRKYLINILLKNSPEYFYKLLTKLSGINLNKISISKISSKLSKINNEMSYYNSLTREWNKDDNIIKFVHKTSIDKRIEDIFNNKEYLFEEKMMISDFFTYLPDDILCKVDRSTMFYSLESRAPFLNKDIIEIAFNLPLKYKLNNGKSKIILKDILSKYLPGHLISNKKKGFGVPIGDLMKDQLKNWTRDILSKDACSKHGFFNSQTVSNTVENHLSGKENNQFKIWSLIQFNLWYENL